MISKQVRAVEPAWIDVSNIATVPENPAVRDVFTCLIVTTYSNPDKLACGLVVPGAPDNTRAIDICMKSDEIGTGYLGYSNGTRSYKCSTNTHPNNTVTPGEFDLVAVSFDCDGNCSTIVKRHRIRILDRAAAPPSPTPTEFVPTQPIPTAIPTVMVIPTGVSIEPTDIPRILPSTLTQPTIQPMYVPTTPMTNSIDASLVVQRPYSVPIVRSQHPETLAMQNLMKQRPKILNDFMSYSNEFISDTFRPFTRRSDIRPWEATKTVLSMLYLNFINEAGL